MDKLSEFVVPKIVALLCPNLEEETGTLQRRIRSLKARKEDVDDELQNAACHSGKKRKREVEDWRNNVENIIKEFETLERRVQQSSRFYHVFKRQELAEQLERMTKEVTELVEQSNDQLFLTPEPDGQALILQNLNDICKSFENGISRSIGIYGMGGIGKTTLAKQAHDRLLKESIYSGHVYWVTVSQEFSVYELQSDIAKLLKLDITHENDEGIRATKLSQKFKKMKKFVLILDDVRKRIDAEKTGIPFDTARCNLIVTSRSLAVCLGMYCQKIIKVNTLSEQEGLGLFLKELECDYVSEEVKEICKKMVNICHGLPLALVALAGSMRGVTKIYKWRDELRGLQDSFLRRPDMEDEALRILLFSYHRLRDPTLKSCLLYCSLYPKDFRFEREGLIENFILEELMESRLSMQAEVKQGHAILNQLVGFCLLERVSDGYLKMRDLIREMTIGITRDEPMYMVKAGLDLEKLPEEQEWTEDLEKVSLMENQIREISPGTSPNCSSLSTLILKGNPLRLIPDCFFQHMCGLRTLDLSYTDIVYLPNSMSDLEKLKALLLRRCSNLVSVPSLEKLKEFRHLDLRDTHIEEVPQGMGSLTKLKRLSLLCDRLKTIPTGTLRRLKHLQQLELPYHLDVPIEEVEALKQLEVFQGRLNSVRDLHRFINSRQIDKQLIFYIIYLGSQEFEPQKELSLPMKHLHFGEGSLMESSLNMDEIMLPRDIKSLCFSSSGLSGCLLDVFPIWNYARDLQECRLDKEDKIECIMMLDGEQQSSTGVPFQSLKTMYVSGLPNFIGLFMWEAVAPLLPGTFSCLEHLTIEGCGKIKKLFPHSLVHNFHNLQELTVKDCVQMEEIIEDDSNEGADITLPMLKKLTLVDLPQLKSIWKGKMICDSIQIISLKHIENVKKLPSNLLLLSGQLSPHPSLESIDTEREWWESLEWADHNAKIVLESLVAYPIDQSLSETESN